MNGYGFTSAWPCPIERLPSCLHAHGAYATISAPLRSDPSFPHYIYVPVSPSPAWREASRDLWRSIGLSTMVVFKLRHSERIHCVCKYNGRTYVHVHGKTNFIFPTFQTRRDSRDRCFIPARKTVDLHTSGAKRAGNWRGGLNGESWPSASRWRRGVRRRRGRRTNDEAGPS